MTIAIPELSLVVLVGVSGSGKSSFAARHFLPTEVLSSDFCRGLVSDDENDQAATPAAFDVLHHVAGKRLEMGRLTVVDATNVQPEARKPLVALARKHHVLAVAIVLDVPESVCAERNAARPDRSFGSHVLRNQRSQLRRSMNNLRREGFHKVDFLHGVDEIEAATVERQPLWNDRRRDHGPFDIIGDVHGCFDELVALLGDLGYEIRLDGAGARHPDGRRAFFVGDLVDRGPATPAVLRLVMGMVDDGDALCVPGNHEAKLLRALRGRNVTVSHGLAETVAQLSAEPPEFSARVETFIDGLVSHLVLDDAKLVVAHAGLRADMQGRASGAVRSFALYGDTTGETDEFGLPVRYPWAEDYRGDAMVVYGHTPVPEATWLNRTICIDTGCVFGGKLTALRYPERELVSVPAARMYWEPARPLAATAPADTTREPTDLDLDDVMGKRIIATRLTQTVTIREEKRHGSPGGDEPLRRRPAVARLSPAHHVAHRHHRTGGPARASRGGPRRLSPGRRGPGRVPGEAHGVAGRRGRVPRCRGRGTPVRRDRRPGGGDDRHPDRAPVLQRPQPGNGAAREGPGRRHPARPVGGDGH